MAREQARMAGDGDVGRAIGEFTQHPGHSLDRPCAAEVGQGRDQGYPALGDPQSAFQCRHIRGHAAIRFRAEPADARVEDLELNSWF